MTTSFGEAPQGPDPILVEAVRDLENRCVPLTEQNLFEEVRDRGVSRNECAAFMEAVRRGQRPQRRTE